MNQELRGELADAVKEGVGTALIWAVRAFWALGTVATVYVAYLLITGKF